VAAEDAVLRSVSPRLVRGVAIAVCVGAIAGMIGGSVADNNGVAITFGLVAAVAALIIIVVTAVSGAGRRTVDPVAGELLEAKVQALVAAGADEAAVRDLVRAAVRLGRGP
jgi:hypothetical protein